MTQKSKYFEIKGYYYDEFADEEITYIVKEYDDYDYMNEDLEIFYYGITESDIIDRIETQQPLCEFVITSYKLLS